MQSFLSDNASPGHPAVIAALGAPPQSHVVSYGDDDETAAAASALGDLVGAAGGVYFVYNGTGANVTALRSMVRPWQAVVCAEMAHINEDEGGAPEALGGFKLLPVERADGRLAPEHLELFRHRRGFVHTSQPAVVSITQATEVGQVYWREHLQELTEAAHGEGYLVHMDGARIANAAAAIAVREGLDCRSAMRAACSGVDVLSFGATKNGLLFGEAVIFLRDNQRLRAAEGEFPFFRKQSAQLHSKMRYISRQFLTYLDGDLWYRNALHANSMARALADGLQNIAGVQLAHPVEANGVFVQIPRRAIEPLREQFPFYIWNEEDATIRLMCSWDTTAERVDQFVTRCAALCR